MEYFAEGKRSVIYKTVKGNKILLTKVEKPGIQAQNRIQNEVSWLKLLNSKGIGPKLISSNGNSFTYEFVPGEFILDWIRKHEKKEILNMLRQVLRQCYILDCLHVTKEEMQHPVKHIIIEKKPVMIDFERCRYTLSPKNVTQFFQFLTGQKLSLIFKEKGIKANNKGLRELLQKYKEKPSDLLFQRLLGRLH